MEFTCKHLQQNFPLLLGCDTSTVNAKWKAPTHLPLGIPWLYKDLGVAAYSRFLLISVVAALVSQERR